VTLFLPGFGDRRQIRPVLTRVLSTAYLTLFLQHELLGRQFSVFDEADEVDAACEATTA